jgi:hypothetical protein
MLITHLPRASTGLQHELSNFKRKQPDARHHPPRQTTATQKFPMEVPLFAVGYKAVVSRGRVTICPGSGA